MMTFYYGKTSMQRLMTCHRDIQAIMCEALAMSDVDITIVCGSRNEEEQEAAFRDGFSLARFGQSPHNFIVKGDGGSPAVDAAPYKNGRIAWEDKALFHRVADFIMAANKKLIEEKVVTHELAWGNDWDGDGIYVAEDPDEDFTDMPHWQIKNWKELI